MLLGQAGQISLWKPFPSRFEINIYFESVAQGQIQSFCLIFQIRVTGVQFVFFFLREGIGFIGSVLKKYESFLTINIENRCFYFKLYKFNPIHKIPQQYHQKMNEPPQKFIQFNKQLNHISIAQRLNLMVQFAYKDQLKRIIILSVGFLLMFTAFGPIESVMIKIYEDNGHEYFGRISIFIIYLIYALSTCFSLSIINALGYKMVFILGSLFYSFFNVSGLIVIQNYSQVLSIFVIVSTSCLCGVAAGSIWVAQAAYVGSVVSDDNLQEMFGLFEGIRNISGFAGYILTYYIFSNYRTETYFYILVPIGLSSCFIFALLADPPKKIIQKQVKQDKVNGFQKLKKYFKLLLIRQNLQIYSYSTMSSIASCIINLFYYKVVQACFQQQIQQNTYDFQMRITSMLGTGLFFYSAGKCLVGFLAKKMMDYMNNFSFCYYSMIGSLVTIAVLALSYYTGNFILCCISSFGLGVSYTTTNISCKTVAKIIFNNDIQLIGITVFTNSISVIFMVVIVAFLQQISIFACFAFFFIVTIIITYHTSVIIQKYDINSKNSLQQKQHHYTQLKSLDKVNQKK